MRPLARRLTAWLLTATALCSAAPALAGEPPPPEPPPLAQMPTLQRLVPAELPPDTPFPSPVVEVVLELDVTAAGQVEAARVARGAGTPFDEAALAAARRFVFTPARLADGEAVPVTVTFALKIEAPPPPPPPPVLYAGTLLERGTRKPLVGVPVAAEADGEIVAEATTDARGRFALTSPAASFRLVAVPVGHERLAQPVEAAPGEELEARFYLEATSGRNVTVVRAGRVQHEVTRRVIPKDAVETAVGTAGDTIKVVQNLPGVARTTFGSGDLILRGSSPEDSKVYLDGMLIPLAYHFGGLRSAINSAFLDELEFLPGNFGPRYGDATGGVVDIKTRDPASDLFRGQVDLNVYDLGLVLEGPVADDVSIGGAFHRSWIDTLLPAFIPDDAQLTFSTLPRYYDYQFVASYRPSDDHRMKLVWFGSSDQLRLVLAQPLDDDPGLRGAIATEMMFHGVLLSDHLKLGPRVRQDITLGYLYGDTYVGVGPGAYVANSWHGVHLRASWRWSAADWLDLRVGVEDVSAVWDVSLLVPRPPKEGSTTASFSSLETIGTETSGTSHSPATYLELALRPIPEVTLLPSVRAQYFPDIDAWAVDPRLSARWELDADTRVFGGVGLYQQQPTGDESLPGFGTPTLGTERALHVSLGASRELLDDRLSIEATGFYKDLDHLVHTNPEAAFDPTAPYYHNAGTGQIYGLELLVKARFEEVFDGWIAYTLQRSLRTDEAGGDERPFDWDQPHILTALGRFQLGAGWSASFRFRLVSGNPQTPIVGSVYDANSDTYVPLYGANNSRRLSPFHQLDLRIDKVFTFETWKLTAYVEVQNAYYHANQEGTSWSYDFARSEPATGLPILPILGVKGEW